MREGDVMMETDVGVIRGYGPRNVGSLLELEKAEK